MRYRFGDTVLDTARLELTRDGTAVDVEPQVLRLLTLLIENRDRVVSREELHERLWPRRIVTDNALNVRIRAARLAVGDSGAAQTIIRTVPREGYRFVAPVESGPHRIASGRTERTEPAAAARRRDQPTIVVLPFAPVAGSRSERIISRGLAHDVITRLARTRLLFVIARGTAFRFSPADDVGAIGSKLGVRYAVQGGVQVAGDRLKVSAALIETGTLTELWSDQYERPLGAFMRIQEEIADRLVGALEAEIQLREMGRSLLMPSSNLDAWSHYHRGLYHMYHFRLDSCDRAEHFFRRSIDLEPNVPRPYAGLSFIHFERVFLGFAPDRRAGIRRAIDYAQQALEIDPRDPMAHWALARAEQLRGRLDVAKRALETAVTLNPSYAIAQYSLGWLALQLGENALCRERIELARELSPYDPLKFAMMSVSALNLALTGQTREAARLAAQSLEQPNAHHLLLAFAALTHAFDGQMDRARALFGRLHATLPGYGLADFLTTFHFRKDDDRRRIGRVFRELERSGPAR